MRATRILSALVASPLLVATLAIAGCSSDDHDGSNAPESKTGGSDSGNSGPAEDVAERPWEVISSKGETLVSNVFYADAVENEQVMPWQVDGRTVIDRLIYPTLGNPNLYVKSDAADELTIVLRIEADAIEHLAPVVSKIDGSALSSMTLKMEDRDGIGFLLVDKSARSRAETDFVLGPGAGAYKIVPKKILVSPEPDELPQSLKQRRTVRFVFDREAMAGVPAGLYDTRFEVRKDGKIWGGVYELQYNSVRVFDEEREEYSALNITDTQVSVDGAYERITTQFLNDFVDAVNASSDPTVRSAAFITFNGDLHNGGAPGTLLQRAVATTYADEAKQVVDALKRLSLPIFLTTGNHDGYVSTGVVPKGVELVDDKVGTDLRTVIAEQNNGAWPGYTWDTYAAYLAKTPPGGIHYDLFTGGFIRTPGDTFKSFTEVPRSDRNMVLYDGFYQWQKTYGPLYGSWTFGKNRYVSLNSFDLRQHRRSGWGMYTVNYGGGIGPVQMSWIDRELARSRVANQDVVMLMHHEPRGGQYANDHGYYVEQKEYVSMVESAVSYMLTDKFAPMVCKQPGAEITIDDRDACQYEGLQEWMAPDPEFDKTSSGLFESGTELLRRVSQNPQVRTLLIGHAHVGVYEMLQEGDELATGKLTVEKDNREGAQPRELLIMRFPSSANITDAVFEGRPAIGWTVLQVDKRYGIPQVNAMSAMVNDESDGFQKIGSIDIDRKKRMSPKAPDNPLEKMYRH